MEDSAEVALFASCIALAAERRRPPRRSCK
jgi:hypothetical protein